MPVGRPLGSEAPTIEMRLNGAFGASLLCAPNWLSEPAFKTPNTPPLYRQNLGTFVYSCRCRCTAPDKNKNVLHLSFNRKNKFVLLVLLSILRYFTPYEPEKFQQDI